MTVVAFLLGLFLGTVGGFLICGLCVAAKASGEAMEGVKYPE